MTASSAPPAGLLIVSVDRLPAWILPAFGCTWASTPCLDGLAGRGLVLDRIIAGGDDPCATLAALAGRGPEDPAAWPLLEAALTRGWSPAVVTDDEAFATRLPAGVMTRCLPAEAVPRIAATVAETSLGRLFAAATELAATGNHRLLWLHAASLGRGWDAPAEFRSAYLDPDDPPPPPGATVPQLQVTAETDPDLVAVVRQVFAGQLMLFDRCLSGLVSAVATSSQSALAAPWVVLMAGVRGLPLGLHGLIGPLPLPPYGELVHLPAVLVDHEGRMAAQRYGGLLLPADLGATLVELVAGGRPAAADPRAGRSLGPLLEEWRFEPRDRAVAVTSHGIAVATPAWQLVLATAAGQPAVFAKPDDYFELNDVADRCPDVAEELAAIARQAAVDPHGAWLAPLSPAATRGPQ
jgi:hypothetical protein